MTIVEEILDDLNQRGEQTLSSLKVALGRIRTGRASLTLLDSVKVDYYGSKSPLNQLATLATPDARLITVKPFDKSLLGEIEKAIRTTSDLGITPQNDGDKIMLPIPPLTEERRRDFTKIAKSKGEDAKISVRNARRDANELLKASEKDGEVPEDDSKRAQQKVQEATDHFVKLIDTAVGRKETEILEI